MNGYGMESVSYAKSFKKMLDARTQGVTTLLCIGNNMKSGQSYYPYMGLSTIAKYEPEMRRLGVSKIARSPRGFLTHYKMVGGDSKKVSAFWARERAGFIARHMAQYRKNPTYRRKLALIAWAYNPG